MATAKQADYLLKLWTRSGRLREVFVSRFPDDYPTASKISLFTSVLREEILGFDKKKVTEGITKAQQDAGWNPMVAKATSRQQGYISYLETIVFGRRKSSFQEEMSYAEADARIKLLIDSKADLHKRATRATYLRRIK